jgi:hypothetical protein
MSVPKTAAAAACAMLLACSPTFDWRELQPEGAGVSVLFPCKPDRHARPLRLLDRKLTMEMLVCEAGGVTFALSFADTQDPAAVGASLDELRRLAVDNVAGTVSSTQPAKVPGMTPNEKAVRVAINGRLPNGASVGEQVVLFARGLRIYQASVIGAKLPSEPVESFVASLRLAS